MEKQAKINIQNIKKFFLNFMINQSIVGKINDLKKTFGINDKLLPFEEILQKAKRFNFKESLKQNITPSRKSKTESWALGQHKLFIQLAIYYIFQKQFSIEKLEYINISDIKEKHFVHFENTFISKSSIFIKYEFLILLLKKVQQRKEWITSQAHMFNSIVQKSTCKDDWRNISKKLFIESNQQFFRSVPQCCQRWKNYQNPIITKEKWTKEEDQSLIYLVQIFGLKWAAISKEFKGSRNDHQVKNRFKCLQKKVSKRFQAKSKPETKIDIIRSYINSTPSLYSKKQNQQNQGTINNQLSSYESIKSQEQKQGLNEQIIDQNKANPRNQQAEDEEEQEQMQLMEYDYAFNELQADHCQNTDDKKNRIQFYTGLNINCKMIAAKATNDEDQLLFSDEQSFFLEENTDKYYGGIFNSAEKGQFTQQVVDKHKQYAQISKLFGNDFRENIESEEWLQNLQEKEYLSWLE